VRKSADQDNHDERTGFRRWNQDAGRLAREAPRRARFAAIGAVPDRAGI